MKIVSPSVPHKTVTSPLNGLYVSQQQFCFKMLELPI